ncbi:MAG: S8 family serine peptidase, partial [Gammaproteobacteria bacterium]|nr:S8 family serine peptidase [Gammaproteobacteria bacterium]
TGIDAAHSDLLHQSVEVIDLVGGGQPDFAETHGTAIAGIIASQPNNEIGMVGIAPKAKLLGLRACWPLAEKSGKATCSSFTLAKALTTAITRKSDIINMSLTGPPDPLLHRLITAGLKNGIIVIGAADSTQNPSNRFPASHQGVIAVTTLSSHVPAAADALISAPGDEILSAVPGDSYDFFSGSSVAAAHVTGAAALLREIDPDINPQKTLDILRASFVKNSAADIKNTPNLYQAISTLRAGKPVNRQISKLTEPVKDH